MFVKLFTTCVCVLTATILSAAMPDNWSWELQDLEQLNSIDESKLTDWEKRVLKTQKELAGKNSSNISFEEYKQLAKKHHPRLVGMVVNLTGNRFEGFKELLLKDPETSKDLYVMVIIGSDVLTPDLFRNLLFKDNIILKQNVWDLGLMNTMLNRYQQIMVDLPDDVVINDLKKIKKAYYSRIEANDGWKKFIIKIELMLKGLQ